MSAEAICVPFTPIGHRGRLSPFECKNMPTKQVFMFRVPHDDTPYINFTVAKNDQEITTSVLGHFLRGKAKMPHYKPVSLNPSSPVGHDDYLPQSPIGILSERALDVLKPLMAPCFDFVPVLIKRKPYYWIRTINPLDVLDRKNCELFMSESDPERILIVEKFTFFKDRIPDPVIFTLPETSTQYFFGTDLVLSIVERAQLRGIRLIDAEEKGAVYQ